MPRVVIIGGGIVGLSSAFFLQREGWDITIIDGRANAAGASEVNAGWICPSHCHPVPAPGLTRQSIKWMASSDSPLYIEPSIRPEMLSWLATFWRHCNTTSYRSGTHAIASLNADALSLLDQMARAGVHFEEHRTGILHIYESRKRLEKDYEGFQEIDQFDLGLGEPLYGDDLYNLEPNLTSRIIGGFWLRHDRQVRPASLTGGLVRYLSSRGVDIRRSTWVTGFEYDNGRVSDVRLSRGRIETDAVLITAGAWSGEVAQLAGRKLPIQPGKGYCLDYTPSPVAVQHALHVDAARHAITPMSGMTRLAGTMEFSGFNDRVRLERAEAIIRGATNTLERWPSGIDRPTIRTGLRPMSADGLPLIGYLPGFSNLAVAAGHGMLGMTMAPSTGAAITELLTTGRQPEVLEPLDPGRF